MPDASVIGQPWVVATYEAETGQLKGAAAVVGASDGSDRAVGDLAGEASRRQAVLLSNAGDSVTWITQSAQVGANGIVVRYSIPDAPAGGGALALLELSIHDSSAKLRFQSVLQLTSRYAWLYGGVLDGTMLFNVPANATTYGTGAGPTHLYDEIQLLPMVALQAGDTVTLAKPAASGATAIAIDFIDLETVPPALQPPTGFLSLTDPACGAIALDTRQTGSVFDGADDSSYGSQFTPALGSNPHNPVGGFSMLEKDYYSTIPGTDLLQDSAPNAAAGGLSMFQLADHNLQGLQACVSAVTSSGGKLLGVWIPPGRFYVRGGLRLPDNITIRGAGIWYSKLSAVDTDAPVSVTVNGVTGIAGTSGNLTFQSQSGGATNVVLSDFSMFGNVTQRDTVDSIYPHGVIGEFTNSTFENLWIEHTITGVKMNGSSKAVRFSNLRVRNVLADGIDFYGYTSGSTIVGCQARSTGDDGFALWSQGSTLAEISSDDSLSDSVALLQWFGHGISIYGGHAISVTRCTVADTLNFSCLDTATHFVPTSLPSSASMSATVSSLDLYRCGGNGFNQQLGAIFVQVDHESIDGITIDHVNVSQPSYAGIDIRPTPPADHSIIATFNNLVFSNIQVQGASSCASVHAWAGGSVALEDVCSCAGAGGPPATCAVDNASAGTFQITADTCSTAGCAAF